MSKIKREDAVKAAMDLQKLMDSGYELQPEDIAARNACEATATRAIVTANVASFVGALAVVNLHPRVKVLSDVKKILVIVGAVVASDILAAPFVNGVRCQRQLLRVKVKLFFYFFYFYFLFFYFFYLFFFFVDTFGRLGANSCTNVVSKTIRRAAGRIERERLWFGRDYESTWHGEETQSKEGCWNAG
jgi:hypothetical protein